jgi:hypothetical protein
MRECACRELTAHTHIRGIQVQNLKDATEIRDSTGHKLLALARAGDTKAGAWVWNARDAQVAHDVATWELTETDRNVTLLTTHLSELWWDNQELMVMERLLTGASSPADVYVTRANQPLYLFLKRYLAAARPVGPTDKQKASSTEHPCDLLLPR